MAKQKYTALIDCDNFFVSCEQTRDETLRNVPVCIVSGNRGCVIARSKEAKALGITMGMPLFMAKKQFPGCIYVNADHRLYTKISKQVMTLLKEFSPTVQIYSIDEAFIDLTGLQTAYGMNYYKIAQKIRAELLEKTGISVSIGISITKTLAKLASDRAKNTESHIILCGRSKIQKYLKATDIDEVWGIGKNISKKLKTYCIKTAGEFLALDDEKINKILGKNGLFVKYELSGKMLSPVRNEKPLPKSISDTKSFEEFTSDLTKLKNELQIHIHNSCTRLRRINAECEVIGLILKTKDFQTYYLKEKLEIPTNFEFDVSKRAFELLERLYNPEILYRSIGISLEKFTYGNQIQPDIFGTKEKQLKREKLGKTLDKLENKFGKNIVKPGFTTKTSFKQGFLTSPNYDEV